MSHAELSESQRRILTALVNDFQQTDEPVKAQRIAETIDRDAGSIRNQMQSLKTLNLVEGVPGPSGGYRPTEDAFAVLDRDRLDDRAKVTLSGNYDRIDVTVDEIDFTNVQHPETCTAHVHLQQSAGQIEPGDPVAIGPTPNSNLVIAGELEVINDTADELVVDVAVAEAPLSPE